MRALVPPASRSFWARIIASFRMSAALPWMGALRARRSAAPRSDHRFEAGAGMGMRRPRIVVTACACRARAK